MNKISVPVMHCNTSDSTWTLNHVLISVLAGVNFV